MSRRRSLQRDLSISLALAALLPLAIAVLVLLHRTDRQRVAAAARELDETAALVCRALDGHLQAHQAGMAVLARELPPLPAAPSATYSRHLLAFHEIYPSYRSLLVADSGGRVVAGAPLVSRATGDSVLGRLPRVVDRAYFQEPRRTGRSFLSDAFQGRGFGGDPIVALSVPLRDDAGRFVGIVEGSLDLAALGGAVRAVIGGADLDLAVADRTGQLLHASERFGVAPLTRVTNDSALARGWRARRGQITRAADGTPVLAAHCATTHGWRALLQRPTTGLEHDRHQRARIVVVALLLAAAGALGAARLVARRITRPLTALAAAVDRFDGASAPPIAVDPDGPEEVVRLGAHFAEMSRRVQERDARTMAALAESQRLREEVTALLERREDEIRARTAELSDRTRALADANAALERLADTDGLTGIGNRRAFDAAYDRAWRTAVRARVPVAIVLLDVDRFKAFNDTAGHPAGDEVLRRVARAVATVPRRSLDIVARYGGEEFVALLYAAAEPDAWRLAERMRAAVEALALPHPALGGDGVVTVSAGVAVARPELSFEPDALLARADAALYAAKAGGRNRVAIMEADAAPRAPEVAVG